MYVSTYISDARLVLCGGGAYNPYIKTGLEKNLQKNNVSVMTAEELNVKQFSLVS